MSLDQFNASLLQSTDPKLLNSSVYLMYEDPQALSLVPLSLPCASMFFKVKWD